MNSFYEDLKRAIAALAPSQWIEITPKGDVDVFFGNWKARVKKAGILHVAVNKTTRGTVIFIGGPRDPSAPAAVATSQGEIPPKPRPVEPAGAPKKLRAQPIETPAPVVAPEPAAKQNAFNGPRPAMASVKDVSGNSYKVRAATIAPVLDKVGHAPGKLTPPRVDSRVAGLALGSTEPRPEATS